MKQSELVIAIIVVVTVLLFAYVKETYSTQISIIEGKPVIASGVLVSSRLLTDGSLFGSTETRAMFNGLDQSCRKALDANSRSIEEFARKHVYFDMTSNNSLAGLEASVPNLYYCSECISDYSGYRNFNTNKRVIDFYYSRKSPINSDHSFVQSLACEFDDAGNVQSIYVSTALSCGSCHA